MRHRFRSWSQRRPFTTALVVLTIPVAVGFWRVQQVANEGTSNNAARIAEEQAIIRALHADLSCIETYVNQNARRALTLQEPGNERITDLFRAFRQALVKGHPKRARHIVRHALREDHRYQRLLRNHPVVQPQLRCRRLLPQPPAPSKPSPTRTPPERTPPTRSPSDPGRPTVTRTISLPGPVTTVTRTATVHVTRPPVTRTRTVTVAPGHQHHGKGHR